MTSRFELWVADGELSASDAGVAVRVTGEVDATDAAEFTERIDQIAGPGRLVLDLAGVHYVDSAGFAALNGILARHTAAIVLPPASPMRRAAALMSIPVHDDDEGARAALGLA